MLQAASVSPEDDFARYLKQSAWIIDLDELEREPDRYAGLRVPPAITACPEAWLVIPLLFKEDLIGFVLLEHSSVRRHLNWEDHDLLKTIGHQLSGYLALTEASEELIEARQFEGFNRLTAYLVHDLKNVSAQLGLVVSNARKHKDNRAFVDDAVRTIENAAGKMNRLLDSLRKGVEHSERRPRLVDLRSLLAEAATEHRNKLPNPELTASQEGSVVSVDPERLKSVIGHLIQNAQEATSQNGFVHIRLAQDDEFAVIEIGDSGSGMDEDFVRNRLFRPFDTTKGSAGMGIGAYESREFVHAAGGSIDVHSEPGTGTTITLRIPRAEQPEPSAPPAGQDRP
jgi:putative PEP-CTERM system histidine kinase